MKKVFSIILLCCIVAVAVRCTPKVAKGITDEPVPTPEQITAQYTAAQLNEGKTLWQDNCNKCHKLFQPDSRTPEKWNRVLGRMIPRAKLNVEQGKLVRAYLIANAKTEK